ncbi:MAG: PLDc N-terminal domain-containing protein [Patescibacteria group bacterium]
MKFFKKVLIVLAFAFMNARSALAATCTLNGKEIPCDQMPDWIWILFVVMGALGVLFFVFWVWMLIDALKNQTENKVMWVLLMIFFSLPGAVVYYIVEKRKRKTI